MNKQYFALYSFAVPVWGKNESIICNLFNAGYTIIPQFLYELLTDYSNETISTLEELYHDKEGQLRHYFDYLASKNLGAYTDRVDAFPKMDLVWHEDSLIKSAVIQIADINKLDYSGLLDNLVLLGCRHLEIWCVEHMNIDSLLALLKQVDNSIIRAIDIYLYYEAGISTNTYLNMHKFCSKINEVFVMRSSSKAKFKEERVFFIKQDLTKKIYNKHMPRDEYIICIEFFTESIKHNPYYNNKVCIDKNGYIKNSIDHERHFGCLPDVNLSDVINSESFRELWYACNDKVLEVRDSPFRYMWMNTHNMKGVNENLYAIDNNAN